MNITVEWANLEHTLLIYTFMEEWGWDDYYTATDQGRAMISAQSHPVDVIFDFSASRIVPTGALKHFGNMFRGFADQPSNLNRMVVVGAMGLLVIIGNVLRNLYPKASANVFETHTIEEAFRLLSASV